jgi:hypothetical protein
MLTPVEPDELPTESLSKLIPDEAEIVTPASVVVERPNDTPPPLIDDELPPASV